MGSLINLPDWIYSAFEFFWNEHIKRVKYNYTIEGRILAILGANQYTVTINNRNYTINAPAKPNVSYVVGDIVFIEVVNNNFDFKYIKCIKPY